MATATKSANAQIAVRRGPSPALVKVKGAYDELTRKFADFRSKKNVELKEARTVSATDAMLAGAGGASGAAVAGLARGAGKKFDIDRKYIDGGSLVLGLAVSGLSAYYDFVPGIVGGSSLAAPATADFFERLVVGDDGELDQ